MNLLQINTQDMAGGAAKLTYQLHQNLKKLGHNSKMLVQIKTSSDSDVISIQTGPSRLRNLSQRLLNGLENTVSLQYWFQSFPYGWLNREPIQSADVINLHNMHGGYFNYLALPWLSHAKPICWSLHDMWAITGHCGYSYDCDRWIKGCHHCPLLQPSEENRGLLGPEATLVDLTRFIWNTKQDIYLRSNLTIVTGSTWMKKQVSQSILAEHAHMVHIPDGADIQVFHPIEQAIARQSLDIPHGASVILVYATPNNRRKGLSYAVEALRHVHVNNPLWIISVGEQGALDELNGTFNVRDLGYLQSDSLRNLAYCAADLFLLPTLADNLPLTVLDSLAAGTPSVAFNVGGIPDAVRHMETGYLARYKDVDDLAHGIETLLNDADLRAKMSHRCREVAEQEYSLELQARRYADLYESMLAENK
jgi:glycosyltransferase involved in cell wall biosynthesis